MPRPTIPYAPERLSADERRCRARRFYFHMDARHTVREFSEEPVEEELLEACILTAGTAPSTGHLQPWRFIVVRSPALKRRIRLAIERGAGAAQDSKPFLESAPVLIVAMALLRGGHGDGPRLRHAPESVGIASGFLIAALHAAGLATIAHPPGQVGLLQRILVRPAHEQPVLILSVGHPAPECRVPDLRRKQLADISVWR